MSALSFPVLFESQCLTRHMQVTLGTYALMKPQSIMLMATPRSRYRDLYKTLLGMSTQRKSLSSPNVPFFSIPTPDKPLRELVINFSECFLITLQHYTSLVVLADYNTRSI
ncbi:hypothetical protein PoB_007681600 [Plakobranchus ocellatus]|uniref:Uncharacterized protein n=1 Tax=Plakobranchus ocellatus TaxID=259542 RepID=A0AAV4E2L4_9GAST|nr:hypothetical protein PoB_007681600 [Plakobranchus ocellatus]